MNGISALIKDLQRTPSCHGRTQLEDKEVVKEEVGTH